MTKSIIGKEIFVSFELPSGETFQAKGLVAAIHVERAPRIRTYADPIGTANYYPTTWRAEISGTGEPLWQSRPTVEKKAKARAEAPEWKCPYCGAPNDRRVKRCGGCGAFRPWAWGAA